MITRESASCGSGTDDIDQRTGITNGAVNGISESVVPRPPEGSLITAKTPKKPTMITMITPEMACCASCVEFTIDPTAAKSAPKSRKPSPK